MALKLIPAGSTIDLASYDAICVGAGFAGATVARRLAEEGHKRVCVVELRDHIAGNAYDCVDRAGILVHLYGPHIYHTVNERVHRFLSRFTQWDPYEHRVLADIHGTLMPVPFNHASLKLAFGEQEGERLYQKLVATFGQNVKVPILELRQAKDEDLTRVADYVYKNVFLYYTMKQWGQTPDEIDPAVTGRVPIFVGDDDRYFPQATWQGMPAQGYTALFERLLDHQNIEVALGLDAREFLAIQEGQVRIDGAPFAGEVIYTGALDELFGCDWGPLPYRSLRMDFETLAMDRFLPVATVNYTTSEEFTRITEFKNLTGQVLEGTTTIMREYPRPYVRGKGMDAYYAIINPTNQGLFKRYHERIKSVDTFHAVGRLAEYRYYDMDGVCASALKLADKLLGSQA